MVISQTPLRIEFTGGSDLPAFYRHEPGAIVNVTINKYIYILVRHPNFIPENKYELTYDKLERANKFSEIQNTLLRKTIKYRKIKSLSLTSFSDLPSKMGLGSSGSFMVGVLNALNQVDGERQSPEKLASEAFYIEGKLAGVKCGCQDQLAAAHGGLRLQEFFPDEKVKSTPIKCRKKTLDILQDNLLLFYTGGKRSSHDLLNNLWKTLEKSKKARSLMARRVSLSHVMAKELSKGSLDNFGEMLHEEWSLKKQIAPIETNDHIDTIYDIAMKNGAEGGKLVGAGGAGFMLFYAPKTKHTQIRKALKKLTPMDFKFTPYGTKIIKSIDSD